MRARTSAARVATAALVLAVVSSCSHVMSSAARSTRDWQFVQSVGGIAVGNPQRDANGEVHLPVDCDVSGLRAVSTSPSAINSGIACEAPAVVVRGRSVYIAVVTSLPSEKSGSAGCPDAHLGALAPGKYAVFHGSAEDTAHPLGFIEVSDQ